MVKLRKYLYQKDQLFFVILAKNSQLLYKQYIDFTASFLNYDWVSISLQVNDATCDAYKGCKFDSRIDFNTMKGSHTSLTNFTHTTTSLTFNETYLLLWNLDLQPDNDLLDINQYLPKNKIKTEQIFAKIIIIGGGLLPSRFKFGLNIGNKNKHDLSSNICFRYIYYFF